MAGFFQVVSPKPTQAGAGIIDYGPQRLIDFMSDRGGQLSQRYQARHVCQLCLCFLQGIFGPFALVLGVPLLAQIEHKSDALVLSFFEHRATNHHGNAAAILSQILFLERMQSSSRLDLCYGTLVAVPPFCRREISAIVRAPKGGLPG